MMCTDSFSPDNRDNNKKFVTVNNETGIVLIR